MGRSGRRSQTTSTLESAIRSPTKRTVEYGACKGVAREDSVGSEAVRERDAVGSGVRVRRHDTRAKVEDDVKTARRRMTRLQARQGRTMRVMKAWR